MSEFNLRPLVDEAVRRSVDPDAWSFDSLGFAEVIKEHFVLRKRPRGPWCAAVLFKLDYVEALDGGYNWRLRRPKSKSGQEDLRP